jgi:hypothetical protein
MPDSEIVETLNGYLYEANLASRRLAEKIKSYLRSA